MYIKKIVGQKIFIVGMLVAFVLPPCWGASGDADGGEQSFSAEAELKSLIELAAQKKQELLKQHEAAVKIQALLRGFKVRADIKHRYDEQKALMPQELLAQEEPSAHQELLEQQELTVLQAQVGDEMSEVQATTPSGESRERVKRDRSDSDAGEPTAKRQCLDASADSTSEPQNSRTSAGFSLKFCAIA